MLNKDDFHTNSDLSANMKCNSSFIVDPIAQSSYFDDSDILESVCNDTYDNICETNAELLPKSNEVYGRLLFETAKIVLQLRLVNPSCSTSVNNCWICKRSNPANVKKKHKHTFKGVFQFTDGFFNISIPDLEKESPSKSCDTDKFNNDSWNQNSISSSNEKNISFGQQIAQTLNLDNYIYDPDSTRPSESFHSKLVADKTSFVADKAPLNSSSSINDAVEEIYLSCQVCCCAALECLFARPAFRPIHSGPTCSRPIHFVQS